MSENGRRARAVELARHAATNADQALSERDAAIRFAAGEGASLRELAAATGVSHMTVKRIVGRPINEALVEAAAADPTIPAPEDWTDEQRAKLRRVVETED
jgi:transposase